MDHTDERTLITTTARDLLAREVTLQRPTIAELLRRTGLERWKLTHRHRDLNDEFLAAVARKWGHAAPDIHPLQKRLTATEAKAQRLAGDVRELTRELRRYAAVIEELRIQLDEAQRAHVQNIHRLDTTRLDTARSSRPHTP
ncbi:hypothetical protein [Microbacterium sp. NPDC079176]|uniref:hypothetical protein n=1 Tax=Microbacterium sp. NPDC079176 TaxID=3154768 RepID=UPI003439F2DE